MAEARTRELAGLVTWWDGGGAFARITAALAAGFLADGWLVDVLLAQNQPGAATPYFPAARRVISLARRSRHSIWPLARYIRRQSPEVVISLGSMLNGPAVLARKFARRSPLLILSEHAVMSREANLEHLGHPLLHRAPTIARRLYPQADALVCVSDAVARDLIGEIRLSAQTLPIRTIGNPIDVARVRSLATEMQSEPVLFGERPVFVSVGRLSPQKHQALLLDAFGSVREKHSRGHLVLVGEGPDRPMLEDKVRSMGLGPHVTFYGWLNNPYPVMAGADVFVLSSREEAFGLVLLEAMALDVPIVLTDCLGGAREVLAEGRVGLIVPRDDPSALAKAMWQLAEDERTRQEFIDEGRRQVQKFESKAIARQWLELVAELRE